MSSHRVLLVVKKVIIAYETCCRGLVKKNSTTVTKYKSHFQQQHQHYSRSVPVSGLHQVYRRKLAIHYWP